MNRKQNDINYGEKSEKEAKLVLEEKFGILNNTDKFYEFDYINDKYVIEIKSRRIEHNKYCSLFFGRNKYIKGEELLKKNSNLRIFYIWKCTDGYYYWEHNTTPYDICKRGRCDRGIDEYKDCIDVKTEYINKLEDLELI